MVKRTEQMRIYRLLVAILAVAVLATVHPGKSLAGSALLKQGEQQIKTGKFKAALRSITTAMNSGKLTDAEMARALYQRGAAYNGLKRYGSAIADLTGAISLGELDASAQKKAYLARAHAFEATSHKKLARADYARAGTGRRAVQGPGNRSKTAATVSAIPAFETVVSASKKRVSPVRAKKTAKPARVKKAAIPAFRTSIATD